MRVAGLMRVVVIAVAASGAGVLAPRVSAQAPTFPSQNTGKLPAPAVGSPDDNNPMSHDPLAAQQEARRQRAAVDDRQRRMQEDTAKLLKLAEELKAEMEKTNKFQMSLEVMRKAEEIEKLARDVKNRMKG